VDYGLIELERFDDDLSLPERSRIEYNVDAPRGKEIPLRKSQRVGQGKFVDADRQSRENAEAQVADRCFFPRSPLNLGNHLGAVAVDVDKPRHQDNHYCQQADQEKSQRDDDLSTARHKLDFQTSDGTRSGGLLARHFRFNDMPA